VSDTRDLCTRADVKQAFETTGSSSARDARIDAAITAVSVHIMSKLERELTPKTDNAARTFAVPLDAPHAIVNLVPFDLRNADQVRLHPEGSAVILAATEFALQPTHKPDGSFVMMQIADTATLQSAFALQFRYAQVEITGDWGIWDTAQVPPHVREAAAQTVRSWLRQGTGLAALADRGVDAPGVQTEPPQTFAIPPGAWSALSYLKRAF
jgi:hypothetical protein